MSNSMTWKSTTGDIPIRLMIIRRTEEIFRSIQLPCEPDVFEDALSSLVPKLEAELYRQASSLEEYGDPRTVKQRLERMAPAREGHVRPLEALWLQGLLTREAPSAAAKIPKSPESDQATTTATETPTPKFTVSPNPFPPQTPFVTAVPLQSPAAYAFDATHRRPQTSDFFMQSLTEAKKYLDAYDSESSRVIVMDVSGTVATAATADCSGVVFDVLQGLTSTPQLANVQTVGLRSADLTCYEGLDDDIRAPTRT